MLFEQNKCIMYVENIAIDPSQKKKKKISMQCYCYET